MNEISRATSTLDLLEAHHNDKEFDAMIVRNKFLSECKAKGFNRMKRLGLISNDRTTKRGIRFTEEQKKEFASRAYQLRRQGLSYQQVRAELGGIAEKSIRDWMKKYDVSSSK
jgi:hypothetical protein